MGRWGRRLSMPNPRTRLSRLLDGLELPKGFRLTPIRESCLRKLGVQMLRDAAPMWTYGPKVNWRNLGGRWSFELSRPEKEALRGMGASKWVVAVCDEPNTASYRRWTRHTLVWQAGIAQLA